MAGPEAMHLDLTSFQSITDFKGGEAAAAHPGEGLMRVYDKRRTAGPAGRRRRCTWT